MKNLYCVLFVVKDLTIKINCHINNFKIILYKIQTCKLYLKTQIYSQALTNGQLFKIHHITNNKLSVAVVLRG